MTPGWLILKARIAADQQAAAKRQRDRLWERRDQVEYVFGRTFFWRCLAAIEERCFAWSDERYLLHYGCYPAGKKISLTRD